MNQSIWRLAKGLSLAAVAATTVVAQAKDVQLSVRTGASVSDNISRVPGDKTSDTIAEVGMGLSVDHQSRRLSVNALGDFAYQDYLQDTYDDEVTGNFSGNAELFIIPKYLSWVASETFGQTRQDLSAGITPANRENINTFETGPDVTISLGGTNEFELFGRYNTIDYEETALDSERISTGAGFKHLLSKQSSIGLHIETEQVNYVDLGDFADFDQQNAFVRYERYNDRNYLSVDAGVARIDGSDGEDDGPLARVSYTRNITSRNVLWVEVSREFSDAGMSSSLYAGMPTTDLSDQALSLTSEPFTSDYAMVGWSIRGRRTDMQISGSRSKETYSQSGSDRVRDEFSFDLTRAFGSGWTGGLSFNYDKSEFESLEPDYAESSAGLSLSYQLSRRLFFDAAYSYSERTGDQSASDYSENRVWLRVRYGEVAANRFGSARRREEISQ